MMTEIPDQQWLQWGIERIGRNKRAQRSLNDLVRMSRHDGDVWIRPINPDRSVLGWTPRARLVQPVIVQCGRPRIRIGKWVQVSPIQKPDSAITFWGRAVCITQPETGRECILIDEWALTTINPKGKQVRP